VIFVSFHPGKENVIFAPSQTHRHRSNPKTNPTSTPGERRAPGETATPTSTARNPRPHQRHRLCPPPYTITQHKTIPILAGVGGGNSTFSITPKIAPHRPATLEIQDIPTSTPGERSAPGETATPTSTARNPRPHQRHRLCAPPYTITQHKTIPILAGVGGGLSTFSFTN
jgi:hypothetical protein